MKANDIHFSVVIPVYNQAQYLSLAIKSVLAQTYSDYEIIVVDDGSTDDSQITAQRFKRDIRYFRQENQGLAGARNTGILNARGEYVAFLDSDDLWESSYLQEMMELTTKQSKASVYYCGVSYIDASGRDLPQKGRIRSISPETMYQVMLRTNPLVPSATILRRSTVIVAGLFDVTFRRLQDWELWVRILKHGYTFVGLDKCLVRYRVHGKALSSDVVGGQQAAKALVEKHFGLNDNRYNEWSADKRQAYGGLYRYFAVTTFLIRQGDWASCAKYLRKAIRVDPTLAIDLNLFYELVLGSQPLGYRGANFDVNLEESERNINYVLEVVFQEPISPELRSIRRLALGTANYALGLVAYNRTNTSLSLHFLWIAIKFRSNLICDSQFISTFAKSLLGRSAVIHLRQVHKLLKVIAKS